MFSLSPPSLPLPLAAPDSQLASQGGEIQEGLASLPLSGFSVFHPLDEVDDLARPAAVANDVGNCGIGDGFPFPTGK